MAPSCNNSLIEKEKFICLQCKGVMSVEKVCGIIQQSSEGSAIMENIEYLQRDMIELNQVLSSVKRQSVKEAIQSEIDIVSAKIESLINQTTANTNNESWSDVVARGRKKASPMLQHKPRQIPVINNRYDLLSLNEKCDKQILQVQCNR
jgi:hypothetical protein